MDYELAKKLKEAGFPQYEEQIMSAEEVSSQTVYLRKNHKTFDLSFLDYPKDEPDYYEQGKWRPSCIFSRKYLESAEAETLYFPTLSELIEACGKGLWALFNEDNSWWARKEVANGKDFRGSTPEDAVANLWLALNEIKQK